MFLNRKISRMPLFYFSRNKQIISQVNGQQICDFNSLEDGSASIQCVVVVNNKLNFEWLAKAIKCCENIVLADGGANRFYDSPFRQSKKIRSIVGDFDSLKPHVRSYYQGRNVEFEQVWNQESNDFEKAVKKAIAKGWNKIFCFGAFGGRLDHTLASMHNTEKLSRQHQDLKICLFGQTNLMYFLRQNVQHEVIISQSLEKKFCGLIPFGKADFVSTKGFKWNLGPEFTHQSLKWGDFISTSNQIQGDTLEVETSNNLFFVSHFKNQVDC